MSNKAVNAGFWAVGMAMLVGCSPGQPEAGERVASAPAATGTPTGIPDAAPANPADPCVAATTPAVASLTGRYEVVSFERFRGGLMTREAALEKVGEAMLMTEAEFRFEGEQLASPRYEIACHNDVPVEGEVPTYEARGLSTFYGVASDRDVVWVMTVNDAEGKYHASFEVVPDSSGAELWQLGDGWLFVLERVEADPE
ncbi:hypothetical protein [Lysobacter sp. F6437]|uniref:hypothetical protein n=1 Tax=Lysobacter sp. F6437 TaxID=3459296 RepID=UPI00403E0317